MRELYYGNVPENIMDTYEVLRTGDQNGYVIYKRVLLDVGVPYTTVKNHVYNLDMVLLTHRHTDHINYSTLKRIQEVRPNIPVFCGQWLVELLETEGIRNINIIKPGNRYKYKDVSFMPFKLVHNVTNIGYFLNDGRTKKTVFHMTDTGELPMHTAYNADVVAIEFNHDATMMDELIEKEIENGNFSHYVTSRYNHLSFQKARFFIENNTKGEDKITVVKLHTSEFFKKYLQNV